MQKIIKTENYDMAIREIKKLQKESDSVTSESAEWEIRTAHDKHQQALGHISNFVLLGLLTPSEYEELSIRQLHIGERITKLQEKRTQQSANLH